MDEMNEACEGLLRASENTTPQDTVSYVIGKDAKGNEIVQTIYLDNFNEKQTCESRDQNKDRSLPDINPASKISEEERLTAIIGIRICPSLKRQLTNEAIERGQTLSEYIHDLIAIGWQKMNEDEEDV